MNLKLTVISLIFVLNAHFCLSMGKKEKISKAETKDEIYYTSKIGDNILICIKSKKDNTMVGFKAMIDIVGQLENPEESYNMLEKAYILRESNSKQSD